MNLLKIHLNINMIINFIEEHYLGLIFCSIVIVAFFVVRSWIKEIPTLDDSDPNNIKWRK